MGGSKGTSTTTMRNIPKYAESYVRSYLDRGVSIAFDAQYNASFTAYTEPTYTDLFQNEIAGIEALATRGRNGNVGINKGFTLITDALAGDYLPGNKAEFQTMLTDATSKPANIYEYQIRNLLGGTLYNTGDLSGENVAYNITSVISTRINDTAAALMYQNNYDSERIIQDGLLRQGIEYSKESVKDAEWLRKAGMFYRVWQQGQYEDSYKIWFEGQVLQVNRIEVLGNTIRSLVGTQSKKTAPFYRPSPAVGAIGGAMAGGAAGGAMAGAIWGEAAGPYGVAAGAVIGGVVGYLSS